MRLYIDLPDDIVEKAHELALKEDRFPKQQIEHMAKLAIAAACRALESEPAGREPASVAGSERRR